MKTRCSIVPWTSLTLCLLLLGPNSIGLAFQDTGAENLQAPQSRSSDPPASPPPADPEEEVTFSADERGYLVGTVRSGGTTTVYTWDFEDRLVREEHPDGTVITHVYDFDGNRVETAIHPPDGPPRIRKFLVDPTGTFPQVVVETDEDGNLLAHHTWGAEGELLATTTPEDGTRFVHSDVQGSTRLLTDEQGEVTDRYDYTASGELREHEGTSEQPYRFAGQRFEEESGLYDLRARWMDPASGRFVSRDPFAGFLAEPLTRNPYLYANADPVNVVDPGGLFGVTDFSAANVIGSTITEIQADVGFSLIDGITGGEEAVLTGIATGLFVAGAHLPRAPVKGVLARRATLVTQLGEVIRPQLREIRRLDPNALVGFRGSLARGTKGPHKGSVPFDPEDFDIDAFIVSEELAKRFSPGTVFRAGSKIDELQEVQRVIDAMLRTAPGFKGLRDEPFTFRIFTFEEIEKRQRRGDAQFFFLP